VRLIGRLAPKEVFIDLSDQVVTLEALTLVKVCVFECSGLFSLGLEPRDLLLQTGLAPIGKLSVILMLSLEDGKRRVGREVVIQKLVDEGAPARLLRIVNVRCLIRICHWLTASHRERCRD
jgi:hypothetical protein